MEWFFQSLQTLHSYCDLLCDLCLPLLLGHSLLFESSSHVLFYSHDGSDIEKPPMMIFTLIYPMHDKTMCQIHLFLIHEKGAEFAKNILDFYGAFYF